MGGKGVATCGDCPAPQINDGAKGCKYPDPCKTNNGGCDSKRKCTDAGKGVATCGDCPAPQINDGAKGCKVAAPHMEVLPGGSLCTGPSSDFNNGKDLPSGFSLDAAVVGYRKCKSGYNVATCKAHCMQIAACGTISINAAGCCFVYESTSCPESSHASKSQYSAYKKLVSLKCKCKSLQLAPVPLDMPSQRPNAQAWTVRL